jgi:hypothetical protein
MLISAQANCCPQPVRNGDTYAVLPLIIINYKVTQTGVKSDQNDPREAGREAHGFKME